MKCGKIVGSVSQLFSYNKYNGLVVTTITIQWLSGNDNDNSTMA